MNRIILAAALLTLSTVTAQAGTDKPNILFIFADDLSYETIGAHGMLDIDTPHLDTLVEEGTSFTHAYNMGAYNGAVCAASRAMLNSGRFLWNSCWLGKSNFKMSRERDAQHMWSQQMKKAGYKTYMTGKWHVNVPPSQVFDVVEDPRGGMPEDFWNKGSDDGTKPRYYGYFRPADEEDYKNGWKPWDKSNGGYWKGGKHWSEVVADHGIEFLKDAAKQDKPFFIYLAFNAAHDPRQAPKEYIDRYPLDRIKLPENFRPEYEFKDEIGCGKNLRDAALAPFPRTEFAVKVHRQEYFALITHMDDQIGRVLQTLKDTGQLDNTYIVFTADHGLAVGHHGLIGKQNMYDHSVRVPFLIVGPDVKPGASNDTPIYLQDAMPTALEIAGEPVPDYVEFKSLLPLLDGSETRHYDSIYGAYKGLQRMICKNGWKLIHYPTINKNRLYNMKADPMEMNDLSANPEYAAKIHELQTELQNLSTAMNDPLDYDDPVGSWEKASSP
ncbi:DUF4976 domain-containing protein [Verrucomicrobia bacterium S94]|nr:DUF4976 domain-containing protein [Verrucomicrobia bacterium S94]